MMESGGGSESTIHLTAKFEFSTVSYTASSVVTEKNTYQYGSTIKFYDLSSLTKIHIYTPCCGMLTATKYQRLTK